MDIYETIIQIEDPHLEEDLREELISKLNLFGYSEEKVEEVALAYWSDFFEKNMASILQSQPSLTSHLLDSEMLKICFDQKFEEYRNLKKDLGIDDIRKYWFPM